MDNKKKIIILIVVIILVIIGIVLFKNSKKQEEVNITVDSEKLVPGPAPENIEEVTKDVLEEYGLKLDDAGKIEEPLLRNKGSKYRIYILEEADIDVDENFVEIYMIDKEIRNEFDVEFEEGELMLKNEKYFVYENVLIKLTGNEKIDNKIINALSK